MKMTVTEIGPDHRPTTVVMEATSTQDVETLSTLALAAASGQPLEFGAVDGAELDVDPGAGDRLAPEATAANVEFCARVAHEANRSWSALHGDPSHVAWEAAPDWQRDSARSGVRFLFDRNLEVGVDGLHREWMRSKLEDGWTFGEVKDPVAKTHPCLRPFTELPSEQQAKDMLFMATVASCAMTLRAHERELAMAEEPTAEEDTAAIASAMRQAAAALGLDGDVVLVGADGSVLADLSADAEAPTDPAPAPGEALPSAEEVGHFEVALRFRCVGTRVGAGGRSAVFELVDPFAEPCPTHGSIHPLMLEVVAPNGADLEDGKAFHQPAREAAERATMDLIRRGRVAMRQEHPGGKVNPFAPPQPKGDCGPN
jgi:hypothetical protein